MGPQTKNKPKPKPKPKPNQADDQADRRVLLLDAALRVTAQSGLRALTHRAVESETGVPHGSTTYYFGSRFDLIRALIQHMHDKDLETVEPIAHGMTMMLADRSKPIDIEQIAAAIAAWIDADPEIQLARFELQLAGARDPELKTLMTGCASTFWRMSEPIAVASGSKNPQQDARMLQSALDGWILDRMTHDDPRDGTIADGITRLLKSFAAAQ